METHGVIYSGDKVIPSYVHDERLYITTDDHFRLIANYRKQIEDLIGEKKINEVNLIGLSGLSGAGKSTAAKILTEDYGFIRVRFADVLKRMLRVVLEESGMDNKNIVSAIDGDLKEEGLAALNWKSARFAMQTLGTEWGRNCIGQNIWANITKRTIEKWLSNGRKVVVDDVRFQNEIDVIGELGGDVHRVIRTDLELGIKTISYEHSSETQDLLGQKVLKNMGSIEDLKTALLEII